MIGEIETGHRTASEISAVIHKGLSVRTQDGRPAKLAIIDDNGQVVEAGDEVAMEAFLVAIKSYKAMLKGLGHLRVTNYPKPI